MATNNTSTLNTNAPGIAALQLTKYDALTTDQLIEKALRKFDNGDKLALALVCRLMDLQSELETIAEEVAGVPLEQLH